MIKENEYAKFFIDENLSNLDDPDDLRAYTSLLKSITEDNKKLRKEIQRLYEWNNLNEKIILRLLEIICKSTR